MQYTWEHPYAFDTAAIPKAAAEQLKLASAAQLKVLIWLACAGQGRFCADTCSAACGLSPAVCEEAMHYWVQRGLLAIDAETKTVSLAPAPPVAVNKPPIADISVPVPEPLVGEVVSAALRPSRTEVLQVKAQDTAFSMLLDTAASKLGKILSPADTATLLYLYRDLSLPVEVILMVIGYAVQNGKGKMAYIEKTAIGWAEDGIKTFEAADAHLRHLETCAQAWETLCEWYDVGSVRPTVAQKEVACRWISEWQMTSEVVQTVLSYTVEKTGKLQFSYADRVMERLHGLHITTAEKAKAELTAEKKPTKKTTSSARMKTAKDRAPSYNIAEYEKMVRRHRPTPPKED